MASRIRIVEGDITKLAVDAIVNAANELMLGGGGVDGAIHRAAGPGLVEECRRVPEVRPGVRCPTRHARITGGHRLPARHVIHTVGPVWRGGGAGEDDDLAACYRNSLDLAVRNRVRSITFPAISTGVFAFPLERATGIAVRTVCEFLDREPSIEQVTFCCFGADARRVYEREITRQGGGHVQS
jgi:O-acetyl-ADP-ribose deacetylase (regulator of RNase III)